jgi:hypothetical protein
MQSPTTAAVAPCAVATAAAVPASCRDKAGATAREQKLAAGLLKEAAGLGSAKQHAGKEHEAVPVPGVPELVFIPGGSAAALRELAKCYQVRGPVSVAVPCFCTFNLVSSSAACQDLGLHTLRSLRPQCSAGAAHWSMKQPRDKTLAMADVGTACLKQLGSSSAAASCRCWFAAPCCTAALPHNAAHCSCT